ncbi:Uncharacterized membrane protein [Ligilactobacillus sp. WC1T17]|uniref:Uncharacterized membrane protein n=1 Tax=Ligilactobacillus ruminis TaxID=1623 RepID=A0ABY1A998_9LACO|nr:Uncharacterized membrane protein [Ligilactobacillus ruminis]
MDKENYLTELAEYLAALTPEERADVLEFYREFIDDANLNDTKAIEQRLGNPKRLSRKILADFSIKEVEMQKENNANQKASLKANSNMILKVILALLATPAALVVLATVFVGLTFFGSIGIGIISLICVLVLVGIVCLYIGFSVLLANLMAGIFYLGLGLLVLGGLMMALVLLYWIIKGVVQFTAQLSQKVYQRLVKRSN